MFSRTAVRHPRLSLRLASRLSASRLLSTAPPRVPSHSVHRSVPVPRRPASSAATAVSSPNMAHAPKVQPDMRHDSADPQTPVINSFFEKETGTWQYVLVDPASFQAVIIDPVLDYDSASGSISTKSADVLLQYVEQEGLRVSRILYVPLISAALRRLLTRFKRDACARRPSHGIPVPQDASRREHPYRYRLAYHQSATDIRPRLWLRRPKAAR